MQQQVIDLIVELYHSMGRPVKAADVMPVIKQRGISLGNGKNDKATLASIMAREITKKGARIQRVGKGEFAPI